MSTTERMITTGPASAAWTTRFALDGIALVKTVRRALRNRVAMTALNELEDHQLRDIGLTRSDVDIAVNRSRLLEDPYQLLPRKLRNQGASRS